MATITATSEGWIIVDGYQGHRSREAPALGPGVTLAADVLRREHDRRIAYDTRAEVSECPCCGDVARRTVAVPYSGPPTHAARLAGQHLAGARCVVRLDDGETIAVEDEAAAYDSRMVAWAIDDTCC